MKAYDKENKRWEAYAWPGGYPIFHICKAGGVLCSKCANENHDLTLDSSDAQWYIVDSDINYEDEYLYCENCSEYIESAYGGPEEEE